MYGGVYAATDLMCHDRVVLWHFSDTLPLSNVRQCDDYFYAERLRHNLIVVGVMHVPGKFVYIS